MLNVKRANKTASLLFEKHYWSMGYQYVLGLDEAGRGTWAGPVVAAAVCLPPERDDLPEVLLGVRDSKQMTPRQRANLVDTIQRTALAWGVGSASATEIDEIGIVPATRLAMRRALEATQHEPDVLLIDALRWPEIDIPQQSIVKGDSLSLSIAAASILAKVWRDKHMQEIDIAYPQFGFAHHKGYGTARHQRALNQYGVCPEHRRTFAPIRILLNEG
ncbi:MAG: ribonuclease HII [Anaerolineae bacterium]